MPKKGSSTVKKRPIEQYEHKDKDRVNNPPVGMVTQRNNEIDKSAAGRWCKANIRFKNYQEYLMGRDFKLSYVDLLFISNFKGGNSVIGGHSDEVNKKLIKYTAKLKAIDKSFKCKSLGRLKSKDIKRLVSFTKEFTDLIKDKNSRINGFGESYASGLLAAHFPELLPILDRRVLLNTNIAKKTDCYANDQIKDIERFYPLLIERFAKELKGSKNKLRELDKIYFTKILSHDKSKSEKKQVKKLR